MKVSIIIPCFNEIYTISKIIDKINKQKKKLFFLKNNVVIETIVIDDKSSDGSRSLVRKLKRENKISKIILNKKNFGKGYCIIEGKKIAKGEVILIQDADLEYDPKDYPKILGKFKNQKINVVYGSRVLNKNRYSFSSQISLHRAFFNHVLTFISNIINFQNLTDAHTCYKAVRRKIFNRILLKEKGFSFCPELNTKLSNINEKIIEVPISYKGRSYSNGKKIKLKDGFFALQTLIKYKFFDNEI